MHRSALAATPGFGGENAERGRDTSGIDHRGLEQVCMANEAGHREVGWSGVEGTRSIHLLQVSLMQHGHPVTEHQGFLLVVGHEKGCRSACALYIANLVAKLAS